MFSVCCACTFCHYRRDADRLQAALANLQQLAASQPQQPRVSGLVCDVSVATDVDRLQQHVAQAFANGPVHRCVSYRERVCGGV